MKDTEKIFADFLTRRGMEMSDKKRRIFKAFYESDRHLSAEEIRLIAGGGDREIGIATVWRSMKLIQMAGLAEEYRFDDGVIRYVKREPGVYGKMICTGCKRPIEFDCSKILPDLREISSTYGFRPEDFDVTLLGKCFLCDDETDFEKE